MTTDLIHRVFHIHTAQQLASYPALRNDTINRLVAGLSHQTIATLGGAEIRFCYAPECEPFAIVQYYPRPAQICFARHWQQLNELCWELTLATGITRVQFVGSDVSCRCWLEENRWIRESL